MLNSLNLLLILGFAVGQVAKRFSVPALVGMILVGMVLQPQLTELLPLAPTFRLIAVMVILMKAGLGLDYEKLRAQGTVALRLGFFPALGEMVVVALIAIWLLGFDLPRGLVLGCILGAESPAVIVPAMLKLKSLGWGVQKGIPDAVLTGSALSNVMLLLLFNLLLTGVSHGGDGSGWLLPLQVISQMGVGVIIGWAVAHGLVFFISKQVWTQTLTQDTLVTASVALFLVLGAEHFPFYSGYLAVMALGFFLIQLDAPLARRLRQGFDSLWSVAEIFLFGLLGVSIQIDTLGQVWGVGLIILAVGTLVGRSIGWWLSTVGSNWTTSEKLFLLPADSAKATVQAAIGAIPLSQGIPGGAEMLALASLSILVTAPLGEWAIPVTAPLLLERHEVDPTKVSSTTKVTLLVAVDDSPFSPELLKRVAAMARPTDAKVLVLHILEAQEDQFIPWLTKICEQVLADLRYELIVKTGNITEGIVNTAMEYGATGIIVGKQRVLGSVSQTVLETSPIPVTVISSIDQEASPI
jgi:NhaP-type Na+/H+ or K+/H+ antiporter